MRESKYLDWMTVSFLGDWSFPQELHCDCRTERKWKVECDRLTPLCFWKACIQASFKTSRSFPTCSNLQVSELIHNSANVAPCQFARVSVHFEDIIDGDNDTFAFHKLPITSRFSVVPGSQIVISRVAYQNNTSKYFINNKTSNATEVTTVLRKRGIDLDNNRFLILQGEVEQISLMKAKVCTNDSFYPTAHL